MLRKIIILTIATVILASAFITCDNGTGGGGGSGGSNKTGGSSGGTSKGTLTISLPVGSSRSAWLHDSDPSVLNELDYNITASGTGETVTRSTKGGGTISISITPGLWTIYVEARYKGALYGTGENTADVKAGQQNTVSIFLSKPVDTTPGDTTHGDGGTTPGGTTPPTGTTPSDPFKITTLADLQAFRDEVNAGEDFSGKYFLLEGNITLPSSWTLINGFKGNFNGNGNTITISSGGPGVFDAIESGGVVENLIVTGSPDNVWNLGSIAYANHGIIRNCKSVISIDSTIMRAGGGIVGQNTGQIINSYSEGLIKSTETLNGYFGGIAAWNNGGTIENCYSTVNMVISNSSLPSESASGIAGYFPFGNIKNCVALGNTITGGASTNVYRIAASGGTFDNNYSDIAGTFSSDTASGRDGETVATLTQTAVESWWKTSAAGGGPGWIIHASKQDAADAIEANPAASPWYWDGTRPRLWFE